MVGFPVVARAIARAFAIVLLGLCARAAICADVPVLTVRDAIGPASADYVVRGIARAERDGAPLVIVALDTPGGLDVSMRTVIQAILAARVPVAVYVSPEGARAASAGTYILYAAHVAAMAPATTLGAATPVAIGLPGSRPPDDRGGLPDRGGPGGNADKDDKDDKDGKGTPRSVRPDAMTAKQVNDAAAFIRGLANERGRNAEWAERAVREAVSLTAHEALRERVIDVVAADVPDLLAQVDGREVRVHGAVRALATRGAAYRDVPPDWRQRLLSAIANPSLALILMMIGLYGLMFEFSSPGFGVAGTVGAICLLLALFALQLLPVNYAGLALILLGVALMAAEAMAPSFGVLGVGGLAAFVAGALLLFDRDVPGFGVPPWLVVATGLVSAAVIVAGGGMAMKARRRPVVSGPEAMIGAAGTVLSTDGPHAWIEVRGERWRAACPEPLARGDAVRVAAIRGLVLDVRRDTPAAHPKETTP